MILLLKIGGHCTEISRKRLSPIHRKTAHPADIA
jgi:hypothetical protein